MIVSLSMRVGIYAALVAVVVCGCFGGYQLYERHLSTDLKRTLTAATDPQATEADVRTYFRDARLQVKTKRDAEVLQKFEKVVQLATDSSETNARVLNQTMDSLRSMTSGDSLFQKLIDIRSEYWRSHSPVPKDLQGQIDKALSDEQARRKQEQTEIESETKRAKEEGETAEKLYAEVRTELELPPLPREQKQEK